MDTVDATDWFLTVEQVKLKESLSYNFHKWGLLEVPTGQEQYWVDRLKQYSIIETTSLNYIDD
jgi:hypothetical protein